jgi:protein SCO1/2
MNNSGLTPMLKWLIPVLVLLALIAFTVDWWAEASRGTLPVLGEVPEFNMIDHTGQPFGRSDLNGKLVVVDFFFSSCPGVCPVMHRNMFDLYHWLEGYDPVKIVSISVDPDRDTLAALQAYADSLGVTDNIWIFLRAPIEEVIDLCENGFMLPAVGLPGGHTTRFALVDHLGRIRGYYDGMDATSVRILKEHLRQLGGELP